MPRCIPTGHILSTENVTYGDTSFVRQCGIVPLMVTQRRKPRPLYVREWRKFMGAKAIDLAVALDIERESYYRLEREPYKLTNEAMVILADAMGIKPNQFWFPPPTPGQERVSLDDLLEDMPENLQRAAILAVRGMAGK